jgi:hypothetical protein
MHLSKFGNPAEGVISLDKTVCMLLVKFRSSRSFNATDISAFNCGLLMTQISA